MRPLYLAGSLVSVALGLTSINLSGQQQLVPMPTGPYQSQSRLVTIGTPEPLKSFLSLGGVVLALGAGGYCFYKGIESNKVQGVKVNQEPDLTQEELEFLQRAPVRVPVAATAGVQDAVRDSIPIRPLTAVPSPKGPIKYQHKVAVQGDKDQLLIDKYLDNNICRIIAATNKSVIICSPTGTGKTTLVGGIIGAAFESDLIPEFHIVDTKGYLHPNKWFGLERLPGCMVVPVMDYTCVAEKIAYVRGIVDARMDPSSPMYGQAHPVWLVLDDYLSTYITIQKDKNFPPELRNQIDIDLIRVITVGREVNVKALVITQSPNVDDLGLSAPVRDNGALIVLGRVDTSKPDQEDGGFGAIWKQLSINQIITAKLVRDRLQEEMQPLEEFATRTGRGIFLTTMGRPRLGLVPDLSWVKGFVLDLDTSGGFSKEPSGDFDTEEIQDTVKDSHLAWGDP